MATSFPFLSIAREHNVPYGDVIRGAEEIANKPAGEPFTLGGPYLKLSMTVQFAICEAQSAENSRRRTIEGAP